VLTTLIYLNRSHAAIFDQKSKIRGKMRILPNTNYNEVKDSDLYVVHDNEEAARFNFASLFIFWYSLFIYGIFNFIGKRRRFFMFLKILLNYLGLY
jgi:hypothetical protein